MIRPTRPSYVREAGKPRASGDDPNQVSPATRAAM